MSDAKEDAGLAQYSYMEFVTASGASPWHIRKLSKAGRKLSGGIDTPSLCGRRYNGWDLESALDTRHDNHTCQRCLARYLARQPHAAAKRGSDDEHQ